MSLKLMGQVWESSHQEGGALLVLLALADFAHDDGGGAWPSIHTLARKSRLKDRQVQRVLKHLEASGEISITRGAGPGGANLYRVFPTGVTMTPSVIKTPGDILTPGVIQYTGGVSSSTPKPLLEPLTKNPPLVPPPGGNPTEIRALPIPQRESPEAGGNHVPRRAAAKNPPELAPEARDKLIAKWSGTLPDVGDRIDAALNHTAVKKAINTERYVDTWLRNDAARVEAVRATASLAGARLADNGHGPPEEPLNPNDPEWADKQSERERRRQAARYSTGGG